MSGYDAQNSNNRQKDIEVLGLGYEGFLFYFVGPSFC